MLELTRQTVDVRRAMVLRLALVLVGAAAIAVSAQVKVFLPFSPVPFTAQTLAVLLVGALLGARSAVASVAVYLVAGISGAPIFTLGGGALCLGGPTGGYLLGFIPTAYLAGLLLHERRQSVLSRFACLAVAVSPTYILGVTWLGLSLPISASAAITNGLLLCLPGEAIKLALATAVLTRANAGRE